MKVIFLDIDGVLNTPVAELGFKELGLNWRKQDWYDSQSHLNAYSVVFDPGAIYCLHRIVEETDAKIVISSTWRLRASLEEMKSWFSSPLLKEAIIDKTESFCAKSHPQLVDKDGRVQRGEEIYAWLQKHPEVTRYAVIDDDSDMDAVRRNFFKTDGYEGLSYKMSTDIIRHLNYRERLTKHYRLDKALDKFLSEFHTCLDCDLDKEYRDSYEADLVNILNDAVNRYKENQTRRYEKEEAERKEKLDKL